MSRRDGGKAWPENGRVAVLHLRSNFTRRGGPEELIRSIVSKADTSRFVHYVALLTAGKTSEPSVLEEDDALRGCVYRVPWGRKGPTWAGFGAVDDLIRSRRIDVLHCHDNRANFMSCFAGRARRLGRVASQHGYIRTSLKMQVLVRMDRLVLRAFDRIVVSSERLGRELGAGLADRVVRIPNGIDLDTWGGAPDVESLRVALGFGKDDRVIGIVSRLHEEKGHMYLLEAVREVVAKHPNIRCLVVGEGPLRAALEGQARALGIAERVVFTGLVQDARSMIALMEIFVQPSVQDCLPLSVLEAMAYGKPVVATRVGDIPDGIEDGVNGRLVPPQDSRGLANALSELLDDPYRLEAMGANARRQVVTRFSDRAMVRGWEAVYQDCATLRARVGS